MKKLQKKWNNFISFFKEAYVELKKVQWPSRKIALRYTLIVIGATLATAIFIGGIDYIFTLVIEKFLE